jgi:hypothetical protein
MTHIELLDLYATEQCSLVNNTPCIPEGRNGSILVTSVDVDKSTIKISEKSVTYGYVFSS